VKLFNTIVVWDVYVLAENEYDARAGALANIVDGLKPSEQVARDVGNRPVRAAWEREPPLVGPAVSDADFAKIKGKTTQDVWDALNKKPEAEKKAKAS
jgi:hypothetical protein